MSGDVSDRKRLISITKGNLANNHIYLSRHHDFFPKEVYGKSSKNKGVGKELTLLVEGLGDRICTDIGINGKNGEPRNFFRNRKWVRKFFKKHKIREGDVVAIEKMGKFMYRIYPFESKNVREGAMIPEHWPTIDSKKPTSIDLFAGCGGMSLGFEMAGFNTLLGVDNNKNSMETFKRSHPSSQLFEADLGELAPSVISKKIGKRRVDVIIGGPPCQGVSLSGPRKLEDPRNRLFLSFVRITKELNPKIFVLENVPGLLGLFKGKLVEAIVSEFEKVGYRVFSKILNAAEYGVPQTRKRVFLVGIRTTPKNFRFPIATHSEEGSLFGNIQEKFITCGEALSDLPPLNESLGTYEQDYWSPPKNKYQQMMCKGSRKVYNHIGTKHAERIKKIIDLVPEGGNYKDLPYEYRNTRNFHVAWTRYHSKKPAPTIDTGHRHHFHYKYNRVPTVRENARLQSFPDSFIFYGNKSEQNRQVGNAVSSFVSTCFSEGGLEMPVKYKIPREYYFRIHQIRPRFKFDVENVLIHMATEISNIPSLPKREFALKVNEAVRRFPGNQTKHAKTIANWRTEISSLFGLIEFLPFNNKCRASRMAVRLANNQDLVEFIKIFLFFFQYPGAHLKEHEAHSFIKAGIKFRPVPYILRILRYGEKSIRKNFGITKAELTHCVFNDLRVTRDQRSVRKVYNLIVSNRKHNIDYDWDPQVTRYAKDILDYMVYADLLKYRSANKCYYLNPSASEAIQAFINSNIYFKDYDPLYKKKRLKLSDVSDVSYKWFAYVNQEIDGNLFKTSIAEYLDGMIKDEQSVLPEEIKSFLEVMKKGVIDTKQIGNFGEALIHGHECARLSNEGKIDIIYKIKHIPDHLGVGYDILSLETDETKRHVEVKTTISRDEISFKQFHLTTNEWIVAEGLDGRYFVYRLSINKNGIRLFVIQDPVNKYKTGNLQMIPRDGADITFNEESGEHQELLLWEK